MGVHSTTPPLEASSPVDGSIRKRVCKACDRCRLKKSKCDGSSPCSRCKSDNAICVFGERKKSHDKIYPKGCVPISSTEASFHRIGAQRQLVAATRHAALPLPYQLSNFTLQIRRDAREPTVPTGCRSTRTIQASTKWAGLGWGPVEGDISRRPSYTRHFGEPRGIEARKPH